MQRPLPPFRVKPMRSDYVRKSVSAEAIREFAQNEPVTIKSARLPLRILKPAAGQRLRVIGRPANDPV